MKRAVLLRFHKRPVVCRNRIRLLRLFNPDVPVYGLYGGREERFADSKAVLEGELDSLYGLEGKSAHWKWKNGDLAIREWYLACGRNLDFDVLHVIEWDLLVLSPLAEAFASVPPGGVGLTGLVPLAQVEDKWCWTSDEGLKGEWEKLLAFARDRFGFSGEPFACIAGGACLPRAFLERYAAVEVPELSNDEARMALFAQALGFELHDTGFFSWSSRAETKFFNLEDRFVGAKEIREQLGRRGGRRVFHPFTVVLGGLVEGAPLYNLWLSFSMMKGLGFFRKGIRGFRPRC